MRKSVLTTAAAAALVTSLLVSASKAQTIPLPPPPAGPTASQPPQSHAVRNAWTAYGIAGGVCTVVYPMADAAVVGLQQRQLVLQEVLSDIVGCWTLGVGGLVLRAYWKPTQAEYWYAHVAFLYDQTPARREKFFADVIGDRKAWTYPPLPVMESALGLEKPAPRHHHQRRHRHRH